jgi:hypothetical protein
MVLQLIGMINPSIRSLAMERIHVKPTLIIDEINWYAPTADQL